MLRPAQCASSSRRRDAQHLGGAHLVARAGLGGAEVVAEAQATHRRGAAAEEVVVHSAVGEGGVVVHGISLEISRCMSPTETFDGEPHRQLQYNSIV